MRRARLMRELDMLSRDPPPGVAVWPATDKDGAERNDVFEATVQGPPDSPYADGAFRLRVTVPARYPHEPPGVLFVTNVYHPNVDGAGRICLDSLKMPPKGAWKPSLNIGQILSQIRLLLAEPNPDDPLMPEISEELRNDPARFRRRAEKHTAQHAAVRSEAETLAADPVEAANDEEVQGGKDKEESCEVAGKRDKPGEADPDAENTPATASLANTSKRAKTDVESS